MELRRRRLRRKICRIYLYTDLFAEIYGFQRQDYVYATRIKIAYNYSVCESQSRDTAFVCSKFAESSRILSPRLTKSQGDESGGLRGEIIPGQRAK